MKKKTTKKKIKPVEKTEKVKHEPVIIINVDAREYKKLMEKFEENNIVWCSGMTATSLPNHLNDVSEHRILILYYMDTGILKWLRLSQMEVAGVKEEEVLSFDDYQEMGFPI